MRILLYNFPGEHKLLINHKVRLDGKYTAIDRVDAMKHIGPTSKHKYLYRTYTLVVGDLVQSLRLKKENAMVHVGIMAIR